MALWIQNITDEPREDDAAHDYAVRVNNNPPLAVLRHVRSLGAAQCLRDAADAIDAQSTPPPHQRAE
jgi:hypothetical protein